jgi:hypothetical protein
MVDSLNELSYVIFKGDENERKQINDATCGEARRHVQRVKLTLHASLSA